MVSVCLPSDALLQHLPSYLGFSYLGHGVSLHSCSRKAQPLLLTLDKGYLLTTTLPDLQRGMAPLGPSALTQPSLLGRGVAPFLNLYFALESAGRWQLPAQSLSALIISKSPCVHYLWVETRLLQPPLSNPANFSWWGSAPWTFSPLQISPRCIGPILILFFFFPTWLLVT